MAVEAHIWGISDGAFWWLFLFACTLTVLACVVRYQLSRADERGADAAVDLYELAELSGGRARVARTAAARLYHTGHLTVEDGAVVARGRLTGAASPIERALFEAVAQASGVQAVSSAYGPGAALPRSAHRGLVAAMSDKGLLVKPALTSSLRWLLSVGLALQAIGLIRALHVHDGGGMPLELAFASMLVGLISLFSVIGDPIVTGRGWSALERQRERHARLSSGRVENRKLALAVALFGGEPLRLSNAEFARAWGIRSEEELREAAEDGRYYSTASP